MRLSVDAERCQGHAHCWMETRELIQFSDDDGHACATDHEFGEAGIAAASRAVEACPEQAVSIIA